MKGLIGFFTNKWVIQFLGLLVLALLVWFAGPLIAIAGKAPLESAWARGVFIGGMFVIWVIYRLVMSLLSRRKDRQMMSELASAESTLSEEEKSSAEEVETLHQGFEEALKLLQETRAQDKGGKQCLYELPWYVIIGAPGSGKTTALENSGLSFPLRERLGKGVVKGVGGTRNCDWWFTNEAVLLDTAGRYTTQDSHQAVDAAAWQGFLQLLKKFRPRRPLNGVMVAVSLADLLQQTEEERARHAAAIRRRVQELHQTLGIRLPIYMLFTKTDLVAGFTDFFADFKEDDRAQVWGETFPAGDPSHPEDWLGKFDASFDELLQRLNKHTFRRVQEEHDISRRSLILDYPQQMALMKPSLLAFLQSTFAPNRYEIPPLLRGIYFTSGTQEGTPIDRVMGILAHAFRLDRQASPMYSGRGKSFFLTRLLKEVIFPEAELAGTDPRIERRQKLIQFGALGAALLVTFGAIGLWAVSYSINKSAIARTDEQIARYRAVDIVPTDSRSNFKMLGLKLDAMLAVRVIWEEAGWLSHFGLYQGGKLEEAAGDVYEQVLTEYFLPSLVSRLQERMQGSEGARPDVLYQLLRVYLMFGQPERLEPKIAAAVTQVDWQQSFATEPESLATLSVHLQNLLQMKPPGTQLDEAFIASVRARLTQVSQTQQCYDRFKTEALLDNSHDFKLADVLRPNGQKVFVLVDGRDISVGIVPGLYTAWGYGDYFLKKSMVSVKECLQQNWVLGVEASSSDPREIERLHEGFRALYLGEYQQYWSGLLTGIKLRPAQNINQTVDMLDMLSRPDSPLRLLLMAVEKNTSLSKVSAAAANLLTQTAAKANLTPDQDTLKLFDSTKKVAGFDSGSAGDPAWRLERYFENYNVLVRGEADKPVPLDVPLGKAKELRDYFMLQTGGGQAQKSAASRAEGMGGDALGQAKIEFARLPEPVRSWLMSLTSSGLSQSLSGAKGALNEKLKAAGIAGGAAAGAGAAGGAAAGGAGGGGGSGGGGGRPSQCKLAFNGKYPFARGSQQDAPLVDFSKFFAPNGVMDQFFQTNLKDFIDTGSPQWRQKSTDGQTLGLSQAAIHEFQLAAKIRDSFFAAGGQAPQVQFDMKPMELDTKVDSFRLNIEGQEIVYRHGPEQVTRIQWPGPAAGSGVRFVFETPDKNQASHAKEGPWALFRMFDEFSLQRSGGMDRYTLTFQAGGFTAQFEIRPLSVNNPFNLAELQNFRCPESL